jgi:CheY-like chemotaxis protein
MSFDDLDRLFGEPGGESRTGKGGEPRQRVLVVDDDRFVLLAVQKVLSKFYDVTTALSATEALSALSAAHAAVILDIRMPGHDGFWACDRIREHHPDIPIIFHTAHQSAKQLDAIEAQHRPFAYIFKDGDVQRLLSTVAAAVELRRGAA